MRERDRERSQEQQDAAAEHQQAAAIQPQFQAAMATWRAENTLTERQTEGIATLEAARAAKPASKWPKLDTEQVLAQGIERIRNPFSTNIHGPYFCGPTFLMSVITEKEPDRFARLVVEVLTKATFDGHKVDARLLEAEPHNSQSTSVDWMFMSAMRNTHPNMFGEYLGEDDAAYGKGDRSIIGNLIDAGGNETAGTSVGRMKKDVKSVLDYKVVESKYFWVEDLVKDSEYPNRFVKKGLPEMIARLPETYDPEETTICGILIGFSEGSGQSLWSQLRGKDPDAHTKEEKKEAKENKESFGERASGLSELPQAIHWNRILTRPKLSNGKYTFELFEHGSKRTEEWTEEKFNQDVYGYVIAERRSK